MTWILVIIFAGTFSVGDPQFVTLTEAQCKTVVKEFYKSQARFAAMCVGPNGETFTFEDAEKAK